MSLWRLFDWKSGFVQKTYSSTSTILTRIRIFANKFSLLLKLLLLQSLNLLWFKVDKSQISAANWLSVVVSTFHCTFIPKFLKQPLLSHLHKFSFNVSQETIHFQPVSVRNKILNETPSLFHFLFVSNFFRSDFRNVSLSTRSTLKPQSKKLDQKHKKT